MGLGEADNAHKREGSDVDGRVEAEQDVRSIGAD